MRRVFDRFLFDDHIKAHLILISWSFPLVLVRTHVKVFQEVSISLDVKASYKVDELYFVDDLFTLQTLVIVRAILVKVLWEFQLILAQGSSISVLLLDPNFGNLSLSHLLNSCLQSIGPAIVAQI